MLRRRPGSDGYRTATAPTQEPESTERDREYSVSFSLKQRIVPDASVILKWVLPAERESHAAQALALLDAFTRDELTLLVPPLWLYEVGNTVARQLPDTANEIMADLLALQMDEPRPDASLAADTIRLVASYGVTFYDAAYHALAIAQDAVLVSADDRYLRSVVPEPHAMALAAWC